MTGIGTLVNVCAIILGGFLGLLFKGGLKQHYQDAVLRCLGLCTLFIGAAGGLSGLLSVSGTRLESGGSLGMILSLVLGTLVGERLNLEGRLGQLGEWLKARASRGEDSRFVEGFVTASLVVCVGAMAIVGSLQDALDHDHHGILLHLRQGGHLFCPSRRGPSGGASPSLPAFSHPCSAAPLSTVSPLSAPCSSSAWASTWLSGIGSAWPICSPR